MTATSNNTLQPSSNNNNNNNKGNQCPFAPKEGYATKAVYQEYFVNNLDTAPRVDVSNEYSLMANVENRDEPLYFWQLYSVLGKDVITQMVTNFYRRVFADDEAPWFRDAFVRLGPIEHHVNTQAAYWIDAMGGGRKYHGGEYRLKFHHENNAKEVMTAAGATRWMYHMRQTLQSMRFDDPRVKPAILDFLGTKMMTYADQFGWKYNAAEMELYQD